MQAMFCGKILPSLYIFLVVAILAKTPLRHINYRPVKNDVASFQAFHHHFSHETYKHHTCSESKLKNPPGENDHSRQKLTAR